MDWKKYLLPTIIIVGVLSLLSWATIPDAKFNNNDCLKIPAPGDHRDFTNGRKHHYKIVEKKLYTYELELRKTNLQDKVISTSKTSIPINEVDRKAKPLDCP